MSTQDGNYWTRRPGRRISRRAALRSAGIGGLGLAGAALLGCGGDDDGSSPASTAAPAGDSTTTATEGAASEAVKGGVLNVHGEDPIGFDPHANFSFRTHQNQSFFQDTLFEFPIGPGTDPADFTPNAHLAESVEQVDETTFVVTLRQGIKWQNKAPVNGREFVAEDVKYSYERMVGRMFTYRDLIEGVVDSMEVVDDHTIRFNLVAPYADFLNNLANHYNWIVAKELDDTYGDSASPEAAVGLGPFILENYEPGVRTSWVANPDYFLGAPHVDRIEFLVLGEVATRDSMLRSGDLDLVNVTTLSRQSIESTNPDLQWFEYYSNGGDIFYYRADPGQFAEDVRVRRAFNLAVDREAWLQSFYLGKGSIYNGPPVLAAYSDWQVPLEELGDGNRWFEYNLDEAKSLLDAAGFDYSREYRVDGTAGYGAATVDRQQLQMDLLSQLGINVVANMKEYGDWLATGHAGIYDDFAFGPMTPQISIDAWVWGLFHSSSGVNKAHLVDPQLDDLVDRTRVLYDVEERREAVAEASRYIADQAVYIYPPVGIVNRAAQPWLKNYVPKLGYFTGKTLRDVWIEGRT